MKQYNGNRSHSGGFNQNRENNSSENYSEKTINVPDFSSPDLLGSDAEKLARDVVKDTELTTSQIRNFYGEVKSIERIIAVNDDKWGEQFNRIKLIKAKAIYNKNRDNKTRSSFGPFAEFLSKSIDRITNDENGKNNFKKFCQLFEAFVGYSSEYAKRQ